LPSKEKFIVTQIPPSASADGGGYLPHTDDDSAYPTQRPGDGAGPDLAAPDDAYHGGHRSARRPGPLRRLFGRRGHDDDLAASLDWAEPQADETKWASRTSGTGVTDATGGAITGGGSDARSGAGGGGVAAGPGAGRAAGDDPLVAGVQPDREELVGRDGRQIRDGLPVREVPGLGPIPGRNGLTGAGGLNAAGGLTGAGSLGGPGDPAAVPTYRAQHRVAGAGAGPGSPGQASPGQADPGQPAGRSQTPPQGQPAVQRPGSLGGLGGPTFTPAPGLEATPGPGTPPSWGGGLPLGAPEASGIPATPLTPPAPPRPAPEPGGPGGGDGDGDGDLLYRVLGGLAMRDLTLVESLLQVVEKLESNEEDAGQLELLYRIDHLATRMRRNSENLLVLAGDDPQGRDLEPVPLLDVARAAISEITDYSRAQISSLPDVEVLGLAADDLSHILAELLENATSKSPESASVVIRAERTGDGTMVISVEDSGIGIPPDQLADMNLRLGRAPVVDPTVTRHMGLYVVGRLAQRHGIRIQLRERPYGGITANVITPSRLIRTDPEAPPRTARRPATRPQPVVSPSGPRLTAVRPPSPGAQERPTRPTPPPAPPASSAPSAPPVPPAPRFAPADPSTLPQRTPSRNSNAAPPPRPAASPAASPAARPAANPAAEPEPPTARADRIRDDLADFRLGQREARAAGPGPASPPVPPAPPPVPPAPPAPGPPSAPELHHSDELSRRNAEQDEGPGAAERKPAGPGEGEPGSQGGTEAGPT
jgi:hypothetical protein